MLRATGASLSGAPTPSLGPLDPPLAEDVKAIEAQRQRLQERWGLLLNNGEVISLRPYRCLSQKLLIKGEQFSLTVAWL